LTEALLRAEQMLAGQPADSSRHLILITDGDFGDKSHLELLPELAAKDIRVHVLGIGTEEGTTVAAIRHRRIVSRLDQGSLQEIARLGKGIYQLASYEDDDTERLLSEVRKSNRANAVADEKTRVWNERFFWLVLLGMLPLLAKFRRVRTEPAGKFGEGARE
jgi:Ca-activated chloride channel family protein